MDREQLKSELKQLIVDECDIDFSVDEISDDEHLLGATANLELDSLDALTIAVEVKERYKKHIDSGNETRLALTSINTLADFILAN